MKDSIIKLWNSLLDSIAELDTGVKFIAILAVFIVIVLFLFIIPVGMVFGFIEGMTEMIILAVQGTTEVL